MAASNDYLPSQFYWPIAYLYWPRAYRYWPLGYSHGLDADRIYVVPEDDREFVIEEGERIRVVANQDREYIVEG